jgi:V8-like Glu-specific endopeptidase
MICRQGNEQGRMRMSWMAGRTGGMSRRARVVTLLSVFATAAGCGALLLIPGNVGAAAVAQGVSSAAPSPTVTTNSTGQAFGGVPEVGALFTESAGALGTHFCTASVVHSTHGDLAVTAAHCLSSVQGQEVVFVPGYANGKEPYGTWTVTAVDTDEAWQSSQNPDDDVAFLRLADSSKGVPIERVTGAERLGTTPATSTLVRVIGYPGGADQPISCVNVARHFSTTQLEFACGGYTDGTSGGPFLDDAPGAGHGTVIGVIGGYEQGGDTPDVSYASAFGPAVAALYRQAEAAS